MIRKAILFIGITALLPQMCAYGDPDVGEVLAAISPHRGGLAVFVAPNDGHLALSLAAGGSAGAQFLVHVLASSETTFPALPAAAQAAGLPEGVVTASRWPGRPALPYADNLVQVLVADLDALGPNAPTEAEVLRVLSPAGAAFIHKGGKWTTKMKPIPKGLGEWRHFDGDETGNSTSADEVVRTPNSVLWIDNDMEVKTGGNPAAYNPLDGIRAAGGRIFYYIQPDRAPGVKWGKQFRLMARNAYSGILEWSADVPNQSFRQSFTVNNDHVYIYRRKEAGEKISIYNAATGEYKTMDESLPLLAEGRRGINDPNFEFFATVRDAGNYLLQSRGYELAAFDKANGKRLWVFASDSKPEPTTVKQILAVSTDLAARRVYVGISTGAIFMGQTYDMIPRWPRGDASAVVALDLISGKELWRTSFNGQHVGQLIPAGDRLVVHGAYPDGCIGVLNASDGKTVWLHDHVVSGKRIVNYSALVRGEKIYVEFFAAGPTQVKTFDLADGKDALFHPGGINSRCVRLAATPNYLIFGLGWFVGKDNSSEFLSAARPGCSHSCVPAFGNLYYSPNACGCLSNLRGTVALTYEPLRPPVPDAQRIEKLTDANTTKGPLIEKGSANGKASLLWDFGMGDWTRQTASLLVAPVSSGDLNLAVNPVAHTVTASRSGAVIWTFTADARISAEPIIQNGTVYLAGHDGYVYALDAGTGACRWRFLAAPAHRFITFNGQIQSAWPIYSMAMYEGKICVAAGLHAEAGGIHMWGLDPATGRPNWHQVLERAPQKAPACTPGMRLNVSENATHQPNNTGLTVDGNTLSLGGFEIKPSETQADLDNRLNTPLPRKKK